MSAHDRPPELAPETHVLTDAWVSFARWNRKAIRNPFVVTVALVQPIILLLLFSAVFSSITGLSGFPVDNYTKFIVPAIVLQTALLTSAGSGIGLVEDIESGLFDKLLVSPMSRTGIFLGKSLSEIVRIVGQAAIIIGIGYLLGASVETGLAGAFAIVLIAAVFSLWYAAFSSIVALLTRSVEATNIVSNLLQIVLLFLSPAFIPEDLLPSWLGTLVVLNPITHGIRATRSLMIDGWHVDALAEPLLIIVGLDVAFTAVGAYMIARAASSGR